MIWGKIVIEVVGGYGTYQKSIKIGSLHYGLELFPPKNPPFKILSIFSPENKSFHVVKTVSTELFPLILNIISYSAFWQWHSRQTCYGLVCMKWLLCRSVGLQPVKKIVHVKKFRHVFPLFCHSQDLLLEKVLRIKGDSLFCCFKN